MHRHIYSKKSEEAKLTGFLHGCRRGHRREEPILIQLVGSWRLANAKRFHAASFFDISNFFGSISTVALNAADAALLEEGDQWIGALTHVNSVVDIPAGDGDQLLLRLAQGTLQGAQSAPLKANKAFNDNVVVPMTHHISAVVEGQNCMRTANTLDGSLVDCSTTVYIDDLARKVVADSATALLATLEAINRIFAHYLSCACLVRMKPNKFMSLNVLATMESGKGGNYSRALCDSQGPRRSRLDTLGIDFTIPSVLLSNGDSTQWANSGGQKEHQERP